GREPLCPMGSNVKVHIRRLHLACARLTQQTGADMSLGELISILKANGHDVMHGQPSEKLNRQPEEFPSITHNKMRQIMHEAVDAEVEAGIEWAQLKSTELVIPGEPEPIRNPYGWRGW